MVFSNLAGTTSKRFEIGEWSYDSGYGQIVANNIYDIYWGGNNPSTGIYSSAATRIGPGQDILALNVGQYYYPDSSPIRNGPPGINAQFTLIVEPSNGYMLMQKRYTLKYIEGNGIWIYDDTASNLGWQKIPFASSISAGPTVETGTFKISSNAVDIIQDTSHQYVKYGNLCFVNLDFSFVPKKPRAMIGIGGLPFKARGLYKGQPMQMIADIVTATSAIYVVPRFYTNNAFTLLTVSYHQIHGLVVWNELYSDDIEPNETCYVRGSFIYPCE